MMKRGSLLAGALAGVLVLMVFTISRLNTLLSPVMRGAPSHQGPVLVLDAGHGGEDGGAVSVTGVPESRINLSIVLKLRDMLGLYGVDPVLLREEDISLHDPSANTLREKKRSDLKNRVAAVEAQENAVLISIHQNTYTDSRYCGAQVFYAPTKDSQPLAEGVQNTIRSELQPDNGREAKLIPESVYFMNHITCPAILVECGFLTNPTEEARLRDESYQRTLATVLTGGLLGMIDNLHMEENLL